MGSLQDGYIKRPMERWMDLEDVPPCVPVYEPDLLERTA